jgi:hypothetical protein
MHGGDADDGGDGGNASDHDDDCGGDGRDHDGDGACTYIYQYMAWMHASTHACIDGHRCMGGYRCMVVMRMMHVHTSIYQCMI